MEQAKQPRFFYGYYVVAAAFIIVAVGIGGNNTYGVFFAPVLTEFGWSRALASGAYSVAGLFTGFGGMLGGRLNDRFGPRVLLSVTALILGLGYILLYYLNSIWQLYLFYGVLTGIGLSSIFTPLLSTVARWFVKRRGLMSGIVSGGTGVGSFIIPLFAGWLISSWGWRIAFVGIAILSWVVMILLAQFLRRDPQSMGLAPDGETKSAQANSRLAVSGFSFGQGIRTPRYWLILVIMLICGYVVFSVSIHLVIYATGLGISQSHAISLIAVAGLFNFPSRFIIGAVCDKIGTRNALLIAMVTMFIALIWLQFARQLWMLYLFAALYGSAWGEIVVPVSPMVAELFGLKSHGSLFGFANAIYTLGLAIGPVVTGRIYDVTQSYQMAFIICAVLSGVSLVLTWLLKINKVASGREPGKALG